MILEIKYRRHNKERYTVCRPRSHVYAFDIIENILLHTNEVELQVKIVKLDSNKE